MKFRDQPLEVSCCTRTRPCAQLAHCVLTVRNGFALALPLAFQLETGCCLERFVQDIGRAHIERKAASTTVQVRHGCLVFHWRKRIRPWRNHALSFLQTEWPFCSRLPTYLARGPFTALHGMSCVRHGAQESCPAGQAPSVPSNPCRFCFLWSHLRLTCHWPSAKCQLAVQRMCASAIW